eukprot:TRINITY_DN4644_c0_g1_i2.p1 TRINITY_DN4644_c0_g1~~TRINITY_DN4644_c0_g1_i2.p1  ORF type:complete len:975 (+),score=180.96 TRINITY_DN4644_c0_g1_i2:74-2926(+)
MSMSGRPAESPTSHFRLSGPCSLPQSYGPMTKPTPPVVARKSSPSALPSTSAEAATRKASQTAQDVGGAAPWWFGKHKQAPSGLVLHEEAAQPLSCSGPTSLDRSSVKFQASSSAQPSTQQQGPYYQPQQWPRPSHHQHHPHQDLQQQHLQQHHQNTSPNSHQNLHQQDGHLETSDLLSTPTELKTELLLPPPRQLSSRPLETSLVESRRGSDDVEQSQQLELKIDYSGIDDRLQNERSLWAAAIEQCQTELIREIQTLSRSVESQVTDALRAVEAVDVMTDRIDAKVLELDSKLAVTSSDFEARWQTASAERQAEVVGIREDIDRQWEEISKDITKSLADIAAKTDSRLQEEREQSKARSQEEHREVLDALAAVCNDIESLRTGQAEQKVALSEFSERHQTALKESSNVLSKAEAVSAKLQKDFSILSAKMVDLEGNVAQQMTSFQSERSEMQRILMEELQARKISELASLQSEDSRHRRDIESLREHSARLLEAVRNEEATQRHAVETRMRVELEALSTQLSLCMQTVSGSTILQDQISQAAAEGGKFSSEALESLNEQLRSEVLAETTRLSTQLSTELLSVRTQLAEGLADVRSQQGAYRAEVESLKGDCNRTRDDVSLRQSELADEIKSKLESLPNRAAVSREDSQNLLLREETQSFLRREDLAVIRSEHGREVAELQGRIGLQSRDIEALQNQLQQRTQETKDVRKQLLDEMESLRREVSEASQRKGSWSFLAAFQESPLVGGCRAGETGPDVATQSPRSEDLVPRSLSTAMRQRGLTANFCTSDELDSLRLKHEAASQEMRLQQRGFFDEVLGHAEAVRHALGSEIEAARSQLNVQIADLQRDQRELQKRQDGLHTQQSNMLEVLQHQQKRSEAVQNQLLGDLGNLKGQFVRNQVETTTHLQTIRHVPDMQTLRRQDGTLEREPSHTASHQSLNLTASHQSLNL